MCIGSGSGPWSARAWERLLRRAGARGVERATLATGLRTALGARLLGELGDEPGPLRRSSESPQEPCGYTHPSPRHLAEIEGRLGPLRLRREAVRRPCYLWAFAQRPPARPATPMWLEGDLLVRSEKATRGEKVDYRAGSFFSWQSSPLSYWYRPGRWSCSQSSVSVSER